MPCDSELAVATKVAAGAPEAEIEITPEMITAGADVLRDNSMIFEVLSPSFAELLSEQILCSALSVKTQVRIA
jgi:hypothetical protein